MRLVPATTVVGALFVIPSSATIESDVTVVVLLFGFGSVVAALMFAVLLIAPTAAFVVCTTSVIGADAPAASVARMHVTVPDAPTAGVVHDQPAALTETNVVFGGVVSVTEIVCASLGPLFDAVSV